MRPCLFIVFLFWSCAVSAQDAMVKYLIKQVDTDSLTIRLREFSGEDSATVYGDRVLIRNRVSNSGNDLAADYIKERFGWFGLDVTDQVYSTNGRNIYATQPGFSDPDKILIICGHYDAVADYCADDNASAISAILEIARVLSGQCFEHTIIYAAWDEEEIGLRGSRHFAEQASANGDDIIGVLNIDMMAYEGDSDFDYDIDLNSDPASAAMKDDLVALTDLYDFNLNVNVIQPGTPLSDHSSFWSEGYGGVLLGEAWSTGDRSPYYHTSADRVSTLNLPYFFELTRLVLTYMTTAARLESVETGVTADDVSMTAVLAGAQYQWYSCSGELEPVIGATEQGFIPESDGSYCVQVVSDGCSGFSDCIPFTVLVAEVLEELAGVRVFPNPASEQINIRLDLAGEPVRLELLSADGKLIREVEFPGTEYDLNVRSLPAGLYLLRLHTEHGAGIYRVLVR